MDPAFVSMSATPLSRRAAVRLAGLCLVSVCFTRPEQPAYALKPGKPSKEKLLAGFREEKTPEELEEEKARLAEEKRIRLEKQRELQASTERRKAGLEEDSGPHLEIESNLRGQYYYPTARKRYLPRVKLAWDALPDVEQAARSNRWPDVASLWTDELSNAVLPMRLYARSLTGQGLNINAKFIDKMNAQTDLYEAALKKLTTAVKRKETAMVLASLTDMRDALSKYRESGHLDAPDFGIGELPEKNRVGSGFGNNNTALYRRNKSFHEGSDG